MTMRSVHHLSSRVLLSSNSELCSPLLPLLSCSPPDLLLYCRDSSILLHSSLAFTYFPALTSALADDQFSPLYWTIGAQIVLYLPDLRGSLLSRVITSLYNPSLPLTFSASEKDELGSLFVQLGISEHLYTVKEQNQEPISRLEESFTEEELAEIIFDKTEGGKLELDVLEKLLEEPEERMDEQAILQEDAEENETKILSRGEILWNEELKNAGYDPRIRRCSVTMDNLDTSVLETYVEIAQTNYDRRKLNIQRKNKQRMNRLRSNMKRIKMEGSDENAVNYGEVHVNGIDGENDNFDNVNNVDKYIDGYFAQSDYERNESDEEIITDLQTKEDANVPAYVEMDTEIVGTNLGNKTDANISFDEWKKENEETPIKIAGTKMELEENFKVGQNISGKEKSDSFHGIFPQINVVKVENKLLGNEVIKDMVDQSLEQIKEGGNLLSKSIQSRSDNDEHDVEFVEVREVQCPDCSIVFSVRSKLLGHLVTQHYSEQLLKVYPYTKSGCPLCKNSGRPKVYQIKDRGGHLRHIGQSHEGILQVVRDEVKDVISMFAKTVKRKLRVKREPEFGDDSRDSIGDSRDSFNDSRDSFNDSRGSFNDSRDSNNDGKNFFNNSQNLTVINVKSEPKEISNVDESPWNVFHELDEICNETETFVSEDTSKIYDKKVIKNESVISPALQEKQEMIRAIKEKNTKASPKKLQMENPYCYSCDVSFPSQGALVEHNAQYLKVHTKVYRCRYCEVSSIGTRNFKDHLLSHKNEKMERMLAKSVGK